MSLIGAGLALGGSIISGIGSKKAGDAAADAAEDAARAAAIASQQAIGKLEQGLTHLDKLQPAIDNFAKLGQDQFNRYQNMMGPMEDSLQDYYMNLDPDEYAAQGNQNAQHQYQSAMNQVNDQLAAQGISNSGMNAQMGMQYGNQMAQTKAQNIMDAPGQVAQQQQGWLGYTSGQGNNAFNQMQSGLGAQQEQASMYQNAYNNMANVYMGQASDNYNMASNNANLASQQYAGGQDALGSGFALGGFLGGEANWGFDKDGKNFDLFRGIGE